MSGHAVRANYLAAGAVDVAVESDDHELLTSLRRQWARTRGRRTYITGGQGSHHQDEAFGDDWELPSDRAYSETCAGIASVMFSWRLLLAGGESAYADLIERTLFNVVATSPAADGRSFFYANTLHQRVPASSQTPTPPPRAPPRRCARRGSTCRAALRTWPAPWPASMPTSRPPTDHGIQIHQYAPSEIRTTLTDGRAVSLDVATRYPSEGSIRVSVIESADEPWTLSLRVPEWADGARLSVEGADGVTQEAPAAGGWARVHRAFRAGDVVELELPMAPRVVVPDPRIDAVRGCVAVERGPEVLALESVDLDGGHDVGEVPCFPTSRRSKTEDASG